jgi:hypothetical protein
MRRCRKAWGGRVVAESYLVELASAATVPCATLSDAHRILDGIGERKPGNLGPNTYCTKAGVVRIWGIYDGAPPVLINSYSPEGIADPVKYGPSPSAPGGGT